MRALRIFIARVAAMFTRARSERELAEELETHLEMEVEENIRRGMTPDEARRAAIVKSGGVEAAKDAYRDQRALPVLEHLGADLRYAARMLRRSPVFTIVAVASLALGIGANSAVFSLTDAVLLRLLPVRDPEQLVLFKWRAQPNSLAGSLDGWVQTDEATGMESSTSFSYLTFTRFRDQSATLQDVFAFAPIEQLSVIVDGYAEVAPGQLVTGRYYAGLGATALRGRTLVPDDDKPGASPVAVITYHYWQRRFALDRAVVGKTISIDRIPVTIVGVTPPSFAGALQVGESPDITLPMSLEPQIQEGGSNLGNPAYWWVRIMGRRKPSASEAQVHAELERVFQQAAREGAEAAAKQSPSETPAKRSTPLLDVEAGGQGLTELRHNFQKPLVILSIVVGLVLLIACANVANLLLARSAAREREITVRLAIGASRARLVTQLLTESILLVLIAEVIGVTLAQWGKHLLLTLQPTDGGEMLLDLPLDLRMLGFATLVALATGLLFGLAPALRATRVELAPSLKDSSKSLSGAPRSMLSKALIVAQIAMSVVLLIEAGLFLRTLYNLDTVDIGFNRDNLLLFRVDPRLNGYGKSESALLYQRLIDRLGAVPGIAAVTLSRHPQLANSSRRSNVYMRGHEPPAGKKNVMPIDLVGPKFFETMQLPIVRGRAFGDRDIAGSPRVAIVNESMVRDYFHGANPIGTRLGFQKDSSNQIEIVGVSKDAKYYSVRGPAEPIVYVPYLQHDVGQANFTVRTVGDALSMTRAVREAVRDVDRNLPIFDVSTQRATAESTLTQERLFAKLSTFFGALAVVLACIGVYGLMSYAASRRTTEIGLRIALGAQTRDIVRLVMQQTMLLVTAGAAIGLGVALAATRVSASLLFGLAPSDPLTLGAAVVLMLTVAALAGYLPARKANEVSPMVVMRGE